MWQLVSCPLTTKIRVCVRRTVCFGSTFLDVSPSLNLTVSFRNHISCNVLFSYLSGSLFLGALFSSSALAFQPYNKMPHEQKCHRCFPFTHFNFVLDLIKYCLPKPNHVDALSVHCLAVKVGSFAHLPTCTSLLLLYSRTGDFGSSLNLFDEILYKDVVVWNAIITACVHNSFHDSSLKFFHEMVSKGRGFDYLTISLLASALSHTKRLTPALVLHGLSLKSGMFSNVLLCNAFIDMYAKCGDLSSSELMFHLMNSRDLVSWNSLISGCYLNNYPEKSLLYFREMAYSGYVQDHITLSCVIAACNCLGDLDFGMAIHGFGIKLGYLESSHISVANSLISFYSQFGDLNSAHMVFRGIAFKDSVSWNSMIDGLASAGYFMEAVQHLRQMQQENSAKLDTVTLVTITSLCAHVMQLKDAKSIHGFSIRRGMESNLHLMNSLLDLYFKCESIRVADYLFQMMLQRDLVTWNNMICGYSQNGQSIKAQCLFKELMLWCPNGSLSTLLAILSSCDSPAFLHFGKSVHCWKLKLGFSSNLMAINSLMYMYVNCGDLRASFSLLLANSAVADTTFWNTMIVGCTRNDHYEEALDTFNLMRQCYQVSHDSVTLVNVISASGNLKLVCQGRKIHGLSLKTRVGKNIRVQNALITMYGRFGDIYSARHVFDYIENYNLCSWNCIVSAFSHNKDAKQAIDIFRGLDIEPNEITVVTILSACTQTGVLRDGKQIHAYIFRFGFQRNPYICATLVDMYSNCGRLDISLRLFESLPNKSIAAWNSMISAYGFHSNGRKAIELFREMISYGVHPTKSTFINLLAACSHSGLVGEGLFYYEHMLSEFGVKPRTEHHVCIVDMLGRFGMLDEAYKFITELSTTEPGIWGALLSACNYHGDTEMGRKVSNILFGMEPDNVGYYVSLSNMFVAAGSWSNAVEFRAIIHDKQLRKPAGYSLIDIDLGKQP